MKKTVLAFFLLFALLGVCSPVFPCYAQEGDLFSFWTKPGNVFPGDTFQLVVRAHDISLKSPVAGFRFQVSYDSSQLRLEEISHSKQIRNGTLQTYEKEGEVRGTYVSEGTSAPLLSGDCIFLTFSVFETVAPGTVELEVHLFDLVTWEETALSEEYQETMSVTVVPALSGIAALQSLVPSQGVLNPAFAPGIYSYEMTVPPEIDRVEFTATASENGTVSVSRKTLGAKGSTTEITVTVTSENQEERSEYKIAVFRENEAESTQKALLERLVPSAGVLSPPFSPEVHSYEMTVGADVSRIEFSMKAADGGTAKVNRKTLNASGNSTEFKITVSSQDQKNNSEYTVLVYREEKEEEELSSLAALERLIPVQGELSPPFDPEIYEYTVEVPFEITQMQFHTKAAENGTVSVNRKNLGAGGSFTQFTVTVTSEDKSEKEFYTVMVYRKEKEEIQEEGTTAKLKSLTPSTGELDPPFDSEIYEYKLSVPAEISSIEFIASAEEDGTVKINRKSLGKMGSTTDITATVTSESGQEKAVYLVSVYREEAQPAVVLEEDEENTVQERTNVSSKTSLQQSPSVEEEEVEKAEEEYQPKSEQDPVTLQQSPQSRTEGVSQSQEFPQSPLILEQNQFPAFLTGMLAAAVLLLIGIVAGMVLFALLFYRKGPPSQG